MNGLFCLHLRIGNFMGFKASLEKVPSPCYYTDTPVPAAEALVSLKSMY